MLHSCYLLLFSLYFLTNICFCSRVAICRPTGCLYYNKTNIHYTFSSSVRDLCVIPDQELSFAPHLNRLTHDCFYQLHQLGSVARSLSTGALATTVHCFVTNRLNYIAYPYILVCQMCDWPVLTVFCALLRDLLANYQRSVM